jgi:hypothetical protein
MLNLINESNTKQITFFIFFLVFIFVWSWAFSIFIEQHYWWILSSFVFFLFFVAREKRLTIKENKERLRIKDRRERRIDFWYSNKFDNLFLF